MASRWTILIHDGRQVLVEASETGVVRRRGKLTEEQIDTIVFELASDALELRALQAELGELQVW